MWQKVKECAHRIHKLEDEGNQQQASRLFLDAVKESDEPGKYTAVFEAFTEVSLFEQLWNDCKCFVISSYFYEGNIILYNPSRIC